MNRHEDMNTLSLICDGEIATAIDAILKTTRLKRVRITSLYVENVELDNGNKLLDSLVELVKKGIDVTILIGRKPDVNHWVRFFEKLEDFGVNLYYNWRIHSKMFLLDCFDEKAALITSANYTHGGLHFRHEVGVCLKDLPLGKYNKLGDFFNYVVGSDETRVLRDVV